MTGNQPDLQGLDALVLCYCTGVTFGDVREACRSGRWPLPGKEATGKLCTGCMGDLRQCLEWLAGVGAR